MLDKIIELTPAYGRSYKTQKSFKSDFNKGLDFDTNRGYISLSELEIIMIKYDIQTVYIKINYAIVYVVRFGKTQGWVKI